MWRWSCPTFLPCNFLRWRKINENYARGWINDLWMCASLNISQSHTHTVSEANLYDLICSFTASLTKERFMLYQRRWKNLFESKHRAFLQLSRLENTGTICAALTWQFVSRCFGYNRLVELNTLMKFQHHQIKWSDR